MDDAELINRFFKEMGLEAYNTRLFKKSALGDGKASYDVRLASVLGSGESEEQDLLGSHTFEGHQITVSRGDYSKLMQLVTQNMLKARENSLNDIENGMLGEYLRSFRTGSLSAHKDGSRFWIKDKGPIIETYIGFIETYRDPAGSRGEFEGFVAMVNKEMSSKFGELVSRAEQFLPLLPWSSAFEKDTFLRPDFTSLDVLTFSGSGIPAGINIPNYDEIRQKEGFKNVSLGNVIPASYKDSNILFLSDSDQELMQKYRVGSFEVQVGLHELLGHGSGKLFYKNKSGEYNFDQATVINPLTKGKITNCYDEGETYDSKFTTIGSSYEECRAECVGLYLSTNRDVLKIFGYEGEDADNVMYVNWLSLLWTAVRSMEMYQLKAGVWGQAHSQARFVILRVLQEADPDLVKVDQRTGSDGKPDLLLSFDRSKLETVAKKAIGDFLVRLQTYKSLGDVTTASKMFNAYSTVDAPFSDYHSVVVARRQPRKMFVQCNTTVDADGNVQLKEYEASHEGLIQSWLERFSGDRVDEILQELWAKDRLYYGS
jgi:dipeptidyl-peptidase-3